ncbi:MAG: aminodeoxychorismate synthase component I [Cellvibrionaceae bacterium]
MNTWKIEYLSDSGAYYSAIRHLPNPIWLDSGRPQAAFGRYDIITAAPSSSFSTDGNLTMITHHADIFSNKSDQHLTSESDPFLLIDTAVQKLGACKDVSLPFTGGALGYFGYNLRGIIEPNLLPIKCDIEIPDMLIGIYQWAIIQDHHEEESYLIAHTSLDDRVQKELLKLVVKRKKIKAKNTRKPIKIKKIKRKVKVKEYAEAINKIHDYIAAGDCYQVNFAQRFEAKYKGDSFQAYQHLRQLLPAPFGCYMEFEGGTILSHSPERFLKVEGEQVETKPIKGTIERGKNEKEDIQKAGELLNSVKDRAENLMIVDLLRNDLSKNCQLGSVETPELFKLESYANVHHLVSKVTGKLRPESSSLDLLKGCFPGGSITGAPKFRSMEIIDELESLERSIYCGSIGYISSNGKMDTNIAIRTIACDEKKMYCWGGGGIVADSETDKEYKESLQKVNVLLEGLTFFSKNEEESSP